VKPPQGGRIVTHEGLLTSRVTDAGGPIITGTGRPGRRRRCRAQDRRPGRGARRSRRGGRRACALQRQPPIFVCARTQCTPAASSVSVWSPALVARLKNTAEPVESLQGAAGGRERSARRERVQTSGRARGPGPGQSRSSGDTDSRSAPAFIGMTAVSALEVRIQQAAHQPDVGRFTATLTKLTKALHEIDRVALVERVERPQWVVSDLDHKPLLHGPPDRGRKVSERDRVRDGRVVDDPAVHQRAPSHLHGREHPRERAARQDRLTSAGPVLRPRQAR